jgi:hypothetical protein
MPGTRRAAPRRGARATVVEPCVDPDNSYSRPNASFAANEEGWLTDSNRRPLLAIETWLGHCGGIASSPVAPNKEQLIGKVVVTTQNNGRIRHSGETFVTSMRALQAVRRL